MISEKSAALVLAAGKGTRMYSKSPKVMQRILGEPMLMYVYQALEQIFGERIRTVVGFRAEELARAFPEREAGFILQEELLGTGHALQVAWPRLKAEGMTELLVINGDTPMLDEDRLRSFLSDAQAEDVSLAFLTLSLDEDNAYGRVVRTGDNGCSIVEAKDYDESLYGPATGEINAGIYYFRMDRIEPLLARLTDNNKSRELYITDLVGLAVSAGLKVRAVLVGGDQNFLGINTPRELVKTESKLRAEIVDRLLDSGVLIHAPESVRIGPLAAIAPGVEIFGPCEIYGRTVVACGARIDSHAWIRNSRIEAGASILPFSHLEDAAVGPGCAVGPYARLRPGAVLEEQAKVGNFVEVKKSRIGKGAKASHLTYLGDTTVGPEVNIGAGTITCNYDGSRKHQTVIGEGAFIGSNTALVAPVTIGRNSVVGAGSVIRKDVPDDTLAVARGDQKHYPRRRQP